MNRKIIRKIAKKHGVSVSEVKRDIQNVIDYTYANSNRNPANIEAQNAVLCKGSVPTPDELMHHIANEVDRRRK